MAQVGVSIVSENCSDNSEWVGLTILLKKEIGSGDGMLWEHATYAKLKKGSPTILFHNLRFMIASKKGSSFLSYVWCRKACTLPKSIH